MKLIWLPFSLALILFLQPAPGTVGHNDRKVENYKPVFMIPVVDDNENGVKTVLLTKIGSNILPTANEDINLDLEDENNNPSKLITGPDDSKNDDDVIQNNEMINYLETPSKTVLSIDVLENDGLTVGILHRGGYTVIPDSSNSSKSIERLGRLLYKYGSVKPKDPQYAEEYEYDDEFDQAEWNTKSRWGWGGKLKPGAGWKPKPKPEWKPVPRPKSKPTMQLKPKSIRKPALKPKPRPAQKPKLKWKSKSKQYGEHDLGYRKSRHKSRDPTSGFNIKGGGGLNIFGNAWTEIDARWTPMIPLIPGIGR